jgi:hypothetical protein
MNEAGRDDVFYFFLGGGVGRVYDEFTLFSFNSLVLIQLKGPTVLPNPKH